MLARNSERRATKRSFICEKWVQKVAQKAPIFVHFCSKRAHFCAKRAHFCSFLRIFDHFFLTHFTQTLQPNLPTPVFTPKINITSEKEPQKTLFFTKSRYF